MQLPLARLSHSLVERRLGAIPEGFALRTLLWAAAQIPDYDQRRPWRANALEDKVKRAFADGLSQPREVRRHG